MLLAEIPQFSKKLRLTAKFDLRMKNNSFEVCLSSWEIPHRLASLSFQLKLTHNFATNRLVPSLISESVSKQERTTGKGVKRNDKFFLFELNPQNAIA